MERYDSYKDSGVEWIGEIPKHWGKSKFKYLTVKDVQYGINSSSDNYSDDGIRFIRTTDISNNGELSEDGVFINEEIVPQFQITEYLDFLISRSGTLGRTYLHLTNERMTYGGYLVRFNFSKLELSKFINFYCLSTPFWDWIELNTIVSTIGNVNGQKYSNLELPLPPLSEQNEIVSFLDTKTSLIDSLIEKTQRKIELLKEKRTSLINEVVTKGLNPNVEMKDSGVEWIGEIPSHWILGRIKHKSEIISKGTTPSTIGREVLDEGSIFYIKVENIKENTVDVPPICFIDKETDNLLSRSSLKENDILVVITGSTTGKVVILPKKFTPSNTNQGISFIRLKDKSDSNVKYTWFWLSSGLIQDQIKVTYTQSTQPNLSMEDLGNFLIPFPPLSEQQQIVSYLDEQTQLIDKTISIEEKRIELLKEYRQSLISEVVTGKRKVVD